MICHEVVGAPRSRCATVAEISSANGSAARGNCPPQVDHSEKGQIHSFIINNYISICNQSIIPFPFINNESLIIHNYISINW